MSDLCQRCHSSSEIRAATGRPTRWDPDSVAQLVAPSPLAPCDTMGGGETTTNGPTGTPMYWTIPIGAVAGALVVLAFERLTKQMTRSPREALSPGNKLLEPEVEASLAAAVDGPRNVFEFWSGGLLFARRSREHLARSYEILSIVNALMLSVCVTFYTAADPDTLFGLVCCIANCALWMATLSSAFFYVVVNSRAGKG